MQYQVTVFRRTIILCARCRKPTYGKQSFRLRLVLGNVWN